MGSARPWAIFVAEIIISIITILWLIKIAVRKERGIRFSALHILGLLFIVLIALQLIPLPPKLLRTVSPKTYWLYAETIPGYDGKNAQTKELEERFFQIASPASRSQGWSRISSNAALPRSDRNTMNGWKPLSIDPYKTREMLFRVISFFLIFVIVSEHFRTHAKRDTLIRAFLAIGLFEAFYGLLEYLSGHQQIFFYKKIYGLESVTGTFINPNHFAGFLEMILPVGFGWFFYKLIGAQQSFASWKERILSLSQPERLRNFLIFFAVSIIFSGLLLSYSRTGIMVCATSLILFLSLIFFWYRRKKIKLAFIIFLLIILISPIIGFGLQKIVEGFSAINIEFTEKGQRKGVWKDSIEIFQGFPAFGTGAGTFDDIFILYSSKSRRVRYDYAHNDYLQILTEAGIPGLAIAVAAISFIMVASYRKITLHRNERQAIFFGLLASFIAILIHEFTDFNLYIYSNALLFTVILALLLLEARPDDRIEGQRLLRLAHVLEFALVLVLVLLLGFYSIRHLPLSIDQLRLKDLSARKDASTDENIRKAIILTNRLTENEKDNPEYSLKLAVLRLDNFDMGKSGLPEIHDIYTLLYRSLSSNPSNYKPFLSLIKLATLKLNIGEGAIDASMISEFETLSNHYIETALVLNPSGLGLSYEAGKYYLDIGENEKAASHLRRVLLLDNNMSPRVFSDISFKEDHGKIAEMIVKNDPLLQMLYGDYLFKEKDYTEAEKFFKRSFDLSKDKTDAYGRLCQIYWNSGREEEMKLLSERMLKGSYATNPESLSEVYYNQALAYEKEKQLFPAMEAARRAVEKNRSEIKYHLLLSKLSLECGDADKAISMLQSLLNTFDSDKIRDYSLDIHFLLAEAYEKENEIVKAYEEYNRALKFDPANTEIRKRINFLQKGLR